MHSSTVRRSPIRRQEDEDEIVRLLDAVHTTPRDDKAGRCKLEEDLFRIVERHFREVLRPYLLAKFGATAGEGGAARYTALMNDFFIKVLDKRPDAFWRAESATELRKWVSVVVSNQMLDYLRREKRYEDVADGLAPLVEERQDFFKEKTGMVLNGEILEQIDLWCREEDSPWHLFGWVLRHRFVDGMTREGIADQLNISIHTARRALDEGIVALRAAVLD